MQQEKFDEFLRTNSKELIWVSFKDRVDEDYLLICDGTPICSFVHQEKLEYYFETGFVLARESVFEIRPSGIPVSEAKLASIDNEEYRRLRRSGLYMPQTE